MPVKHRGRQQVRMSSGFSSLVLAGNGQLTVPWCGGMLSDVDTCDGPNLLGAR